MIVRDIPCCRGEPEVWLVWQLCLDFEARCPFVVVARHDLQLSRENWQLFAVPPPLRVRWAEYTTHLKQAVLEICQSRFGWKVSAPEVLLISVRDVFQQISPERGW